MGYALGGGSGWVLLTYVPRDGRLVNQYAAEHSQAIAGGVPILALDMYEHAYHMDFGANAKAYVDTFLRNVDWPALELRYEDAAKVPGPRPLEQPEFGDVQGIGVEEVKEMIAAGKPVQVIDVRPRASFAREDFVHRLRRLAVTAHAGKVQLVQQRRVERGQLLAFKPVQDMRRRVREI